MAEARGGQRRSNRPARPRKRDLHEAPTRKPWTRPLPITSIVESVAITAMAARTIFCFVVSMVESAIVSTKRFVHFPGRRGSHPGSGSIARSTRSVNEMGRSGRSSSNRRRSPRLWASASASIEAALTGNYRSRGGRAGRRRRRCQLRPRRGRGRRARDRGRAARSHTPCRRSVHEFPRAEIHEDHAASVRRAHHVLCFDVSMDRVRRWTAARARQSSWPMSVVSPGLRRPLDKRSVSVSPSMRSIQNPIRPSCMSAP